MNINFLLEQINELKHYENPEVQSPEFQAFVNGWNNALKEVVLIIEKEVT